MDRAAYWHQAYGRLIAHGQDRQPDGYHYTPAALNIYPRNNVLDAILTEIERFVPDDFASDMEAKDLLAIAGHTAQSVFTQGAKDPTALKTMDEEREAYASFINQLDKSALASTEPLFFRRVLSDAETNRISEALHRQWEAGLGDWFPPVGSTRPDTAEFDADAFHDGVPLGTLRQVLLRRGIHRVFELREYGPSYVIDVSAFEPYYTGAEGHFTDQTAGWVIFASHEGSIGVGGKWLLDELRAIWPDWTPRTWKRR